MFYANFLHLFVKSDAFTIDVNDVEKAIGCINFDNVIGCWRVEKNKTIIFPRNELTLIENTIAEIPEYKSTLIAIDNEWDTDEICDKIIEHKRVMIRALFPGYC